MNYMIYDCKKEKVVLEILRIHRSFIIAKNKITAFSANEIEIGKKTLPIGRYYKKEVGEVLKTFASL